MVHGVHGKTTNGGSDVQPARPSGLTQLSVLVVGITGDSNGGTAVLMDQTDFTTLQANGNVLGDAIHLLLLALRNALFLTGPLFRFRLGLLGGRQLVGPLGDDGGKGTRATAQLASLARTQAHVEDQRTNGHHVQRQAVSSPCRSGREDTRINGTAHALPQMLGDAGHVTLHHIPRSHTFGRHDISQPLRLLVAKQSNVRAPPRIVFDALHQLGARCISQEIDRSNTALVTTTLMPDGHSTRVVTTALPVTPFGKRQLLYRTSLPDVVIDRPAQMSDTRRPGFI